MPLLLIKTQDGPLNTLSDVTAWVRLVRMFRLFPLLRSLVVLSLTVRLRNTQNRKIFLQQLVHLQCSWTQQSVGWRCCLVLLFPK